MKNPKYSDSQLTTSLNKLTTNDVHKYFWWDNVLATFNIPQMYKFFKLKAWYLSIVSTDKPFSVSKVFLQS